MNLKFIEEYGYEKIFNFNVPLISLFLTSSLNFCKFSSIIIENRASHLIKVKKRVIKSLKSVI